MAPADASSTNPTLNFVYGIKGHPFLQNFILLSCFAYLLKIGTTSSANFTILPNLIERSREEHTATKDWITNKNISVYTSVPIFHNSSNVRSTGEFTNDYVMYTFSSTKSENSKEIQPGMHTTLLKRHLTNNTKQTEDNVPLPSKTSTDRTESIKSLPTGPHIHPTMTYVTEKPPDFEKDDQTKTVTLLVKHVTKGSDRELLYTTISKKTTTKPFSIPSALTSKTSQINDGGPQKEGRPQVKPVTKTEALNPETGSRQWEGAGTTLDLHIIDKEDIEDQTLELNTRHVSNDVFSTTVTSGRAEDDSESMHRNNTSSPAEKMKTQTSDVFTGYYNFYYNKDYS